MTVRRDSGVPLYVQLKESLQEKIAQGEWVVGMELPSEQELCDTYGVSRTVVRQALDDLSL
jgi:GntR family transcriptional regulator